MLEKVKRLRRAADKESELIRAMNEFFNHEENRFEFTLRTTQGLEHVYSMPGSVAFVAPNTVIVIGTKQRGDGVPRMLFGDVFSIMAHADTEKMDLTETRAAFRAFWSTENGNGDADEEDKGKADKGKSKSKTDKLKAKLAAKAAKAAKAKAKAAKEETVEEFIKREYKLDQEAWDSIVEYLEFNEVDLNDRDEVESFVEELLT